MKRSILILIINFMLIGFVFPKNIKILAPNGGERWSVGSNKNINWSASALNNKIKISLWRDGRFLGLIVKNINPTSGRYNWTVGKYIGGTAPTGSSYKIKIREQGGAAFTTSDLSNLNFMLTTSKSALTLTEPSGQDFLMNGSNFTIKWRTFSISGFIKLTLWNSNKFVGIIANRVEAKNRAYNWKVGTILSDRSRRARGIVQLKSGYKIKIESLENSSVYYFCIFPFDITMASAIIKKNTIVKMITPDLSLFPKTKLDGDIGFFDIKPIYKDSEKTLLEGVDIGMAISSNNKYKIIDNGNHGAGTFYINVILKTYDESYYNRVIDRSYTVENFSTSGKRNGMNIGRIVPRFNKDWVFKRGMNTIRMRIMFKSILKPIGIEERVYFSRNAYLLNLIPSSFGDYKGILKCYIWLPSLRIRVFMDTADHIKHYDKTFELHSRSLLYFVRRMEKTDAGGLIGQGCRLTKKKWVRGLNR